MLKLSTILGVIRIFKSTYVSYVKIGAILSSEKFTTENKNIIGQSIRGSESKVTPS